MSPRCLFVASAIDCRAGNHSGATPGMPTALRVEALQVDHPSRMHLNVEANDIDAGTACPEALDAACIGFTKR